MANHLLIAFTKIIIIDGETLLTGSFNFSSAAERSNAENLIEINNAPEVLAKYSANWIEHQRHSEPYSGKPN